MRVPISQPLRARKIFLSATSITLSDVGRVLNAGEANRGAGLLLRWLWMREYCVSLSGAAVIDKELHTYSVAAGQVIPANMITRYESGTAIRIVHFRIGALILLEIWMLSKEIYTDCCVHSRGFTAIYGRINRYRDRVFRTGVQQRFT